MAGRHVSRHVSKQLTAKTVAKKTPLVSTKKRLPERTFDAIDSQNNKQLLQAMIVYDTSKVGTLPELWLSAIDDDVQPIGLQDRT